MFRHGSTYNKANTIKLSRVTPVNKVVRPPVPLYRPVVPIPAVIEKITLLSTVDVIENPKPIEPSSSGLKLSLKKKVII